MVETRALTLGEIQMMQIVYGEAVDYSRVRIQDGGALPMTGLVVSGDLISMGLGAYRSDYSAEGTPLGLR